MHSTGIFKENYTHSHVRFIWCKTSKR